MNIFVTSMFFRTKGKVDDYLRQFMINCVHIQGQQKSLFSIVLFLFIRVIKVSLLATVLSSKEIIILPDGLFGQGKELHLPSLG